MEITVFLHDCSQEQETGFASTCAEFPEANGQGETAQEAIADLQAAIRDILDYRRAGARKSLSSSDFIEVVAA